MLENKISYHKNRENSSTVLIQGKKKQQGQVKPVSHGRGKMKKVQVTLTSSPSK